MLNVLKFIAGTLALCFIFYGALWLMLALGTIAGF
jgi:hypothetical protein